MISKMFNKSNKANLIFCVGKEQKNKHLFVDLSQIAHLLIVGSVITKRLTSLKSIIDQFTSEFSSTEMKFVFIDTDKNKKLKMFENSSYLLRSKVTNLLETLIVLDCLIEEMEKRYKCMNNNNVISIAEVEERSKIKIPYIVLVLNNISVLLEIKDSEAGKTVEDQLIKLLQLGRGVGIHLIVIESGKDKPLYNNLVYVNITSRLMFGSSKDKIIYNTLGYYPKNKKISDWGNALFISYTTNNLSIGTRLEV